jgi:hypothetical protein
MTTAEIARLEDASRAAMVSAADVYEGNSHFSALVWAIAPALGILAVAATLLFAVL